MKLLKTKRV